MSAKLFCTLLAYDAYDAYDVMDNDNLATDHETRILTDKHGQNTISGANGFGIKTVLHPLFSRQFKMNDRNLCYHCLAHPVFSDMMYRCAQVYATDFGWVRAFPMAFRSEAHETLLLLFAQDGVLSAYICVNAQELIQGKLHHNLKHAACHLRQLE